MAIRKRAKPFDPARRYRTNEPGRTDGREADSISPAQSTRRPRSAFKAMQARVVTRTIQDVREEYGDNVRVVMTPGKRRVTLVQYWREPEGKRRPVSESEIASDIQTLSPSDLGLL